MTGAGWTAREKIRQARAMPTAKTIWTVSELLENRYGVEKWCDRCGWLPDLDLAGLVAAGYGDRPPISLGLKCRRCRAPVRLTIQPPKSGGPMSPGVMASLTSPDSSC